MSHHTPGSLATTVLAMRQYAAGSPIVLVEGSTDISLYSNFFAHKSTYHHVVCDGKSNLIGAVGELNDENRWRVLAICDADYDRILDGPPSADVVLTDLHDSEMLAFSCDAFDRIIDELLHLANATVANRDRVREAAFPVAQKIGRLRMRSRSDGLGLNFKAVEISTFVRADWSFDLEGYMARLLDQSRNSGLSIQRACEIANGFSEPDIANLEELVNGHDLAGLTGAFATLPFNLAVCSREMVEAMMRLSLWPEEFERSSMYSLIQAWESTHGASILN